jgi:hypothetical protein
MPPSYFVTNAFRHYKTGNYHLCCVSIAIVKINSDEGQFPQSTYHVVHLQRHYYREYIQCSTVMYQTQRR